MGHPHRQVHCRGLQRHRPFRPQTPRMIWPVGHSLVPELLAQWRQSCHRSVGRSFAPQQPRPAAQHWDMRPVPHNSQSLGKGQSRRSKNQAQAAQSSSGWRVNMLPHQWSRRAPGSASGHLSPGEFGGKRHREKPGSGRTRWFQSTTHRWAADALSQQRENAHS